MTPIVLAWIGAAFMVGMSGLASAIGTSIAAQAAVGALKKNRGASGSYLILSALPGSQGLYGFAGYYIFANISGLFTDSITWVQAGGIFAGGLIMGFVALFSSMMQGRICANGITAIGNGHNVRNNTLILAVIPELYAILGFATLFLINTMIS